MKYKAKYKTKYAVSAFVFLLTNLAIPAVARAGVFEVSAAASYTRDNYDNNGDYEWTRRYGLSFGYHLNETSEIEVSYQNVTDQTQIAGFENTTFYDQIYSLDWVQAFTGKNQPFQPYVKVGIGELNRQASGSYAGGLAPPAILDEVTGILGAGLRLYFTKSFALRGEFTTYLDDGQISTWQQNIAASIGFSVFF